MGIATGRVELMEMAEVLRLGELGYMLTESSKQVQDMDELRRYVADTLGSFELLQVDQCHFSEKLLYRGETPCGVHFRLYGPRAVCLSAIWETDRNSILFYGSCGRRLLRTMLLQAPSVSEYTYPTAT